MVSISALMSGSYARLAEVLVSECSRLHMYDVHKDTSFNRCESFVFSNVQSKHYIRIFFLFSLILHFKLLNVVSLHSVIKLDEEQCLASVLLCPLIQT